MAVVEHTSEESLEQGVVKFDVETSESIKGCEVLVNLANLGNLLHLWTCVVQVQPDHVCLAYERIEHL